jgi:hypothetical protein
MGLDQYLYAVQHVSNSKYTNVAEGELFNRIHDLMPETSEFIDENGLTFAEIKVQIAYWRKANAIHNFFVQHCGKGKDECQTINVEKQDLRELVRLCHVVLKNRSTEDAKKYLPTVSGFFFGPTDYDEYYYEELERTQKTVQQILNVAPCLWSFVYMGSW